MNVITDIASNLIFQDLNVHIFVLSQNFFVNSLTILKN